MAKLEIRYNPYDQNLYWCCADCNKYHTLCVTPILDCRPDKCYYCDSEFVYVVDDYKRYLDDTWQN